LKRRVLHRNGIVEYHHHAVTGIASERAAVFDDFLADCRMVVAQQGHHVFSIRAFGEPSETAKVAEERCDFPSMAFELLLSPRSDDQISYLRRQETSQPAHALDFAHLVGDAQFELLV
jgi:hypothetical protein